MEKVENENKVVNVGKTQQSKEKINKGKQIQNNNKKIFK